MSPNERSHGESFIDLVVHRFGPNGLYFLDEPEAALSIRGQFRLPTFGAGRRCRSRLSAAGQNVVPRTGEDAVSGTRFATAFTRVRP